MCTALCTCPIMTDGVTAQCCALAPLYGNKERNICKKKKTKANEKIKMTERSSSDSEDDNFSLRDSDEEDYDTFAERITQEILEEEEFERELLEETDRQKADTKKTEMNPSPLKPKEEMVVGDWAIVKFDGKTTTRYFIGQIIEFDQGEPIFKYVKSSSSKNGQTTCKQPTREDVSSVPMEDIVTYLPPPTTGRRGDIIFKMDLSNWTLE
ncbi:hypothetical protein GE061_007667 [Apolygus lucorum]|uniref:SGF29 C-terminal domain-containing protein n=1 Tax=Apolygus lucorum TaxID=248454 RepID=A0A6A4J3P2_APOLU|nr:hypothetical protein GE061_007667 [Apolygus lucorum]